MTNENIENEIRVGGLVSYCMCVVKASLRLSPQFSHHLGSLLDLDGLKDTSLPVVGFCSIIYFCCIPVWSVFHVPRMHCNAVFPVIHFYCILMIPVSFT